MPHPRPRPAAAATLPLLAAFLLAPASSSSAAGEPSGASPSGAAHGAAPPGVLVSRPVAEQLGLERGDVVTLRADPSGGAGREFRVVGSYEPVPDPWRISQRRLEVRLHLPDLLALAADPGDPGDAETIDRFNVVLRPGADLDDLRHGLEARQPELRVGKASYSGTAFVVLERFHLAISIVTVLGSTAFLLALMVMRSEERRRVVGVLRLLGVRRGRVLLHALMEGLVVTLAGTLFGVLLARMGQGAVNAFFQWHYDTSLVFVRVSPDIALRCLVLAAPLGVVAGLAASWASLRRPLPDLLPR